MIDHLMGRPSAPWKRSQVFLVILFWIGQLVRGSRRGPKVLWLRKANRLLNQFSPWQVLVSSFTFLYASRNLDTILGLAAPNPLARLYSKAYYRATWIATGMDAGFATAGSIRQKWLRDICSVVFSLYYLLYANAAEEKLRKHRAVCTVEFLRTTWQKTDNPYIKAIIRLRLPKLGVLRKVQLPRPPKSKYSKPITAWLYFGGTVEELARCTDLILDCPGGGFVAMNPQHHEERLRLWTVHSKRPLLALDYGKAPEYPYPWAIEEGFDAYQTIMADKGRSLGMSGTHLDIILAGDSAGGNLAVCIMLKILESEHFIPRPLALVLSYPALDFNYTSWMSPDNLAILRSEASSAYIPGLNAQKNHLSHRSPLSVVNDVRPRSKRTKSGKRSRSESASSARTGSEVPVGRKDATSLEAARPNVTQRMSVSSLPTTAAGVHKGQARKSVSFVPAGYSRPVDSDGSDNDRSGKGSGSDADEDEPERGRSEGSILARVMTSEADLTSTPAVMTPAEEVDVEIAEDKPETKKIPLGTRLTMTSRSGYFQDPIISPSMMRAMAILYIGPNQLPDFDRDYYISPILAPSSLLAQFPPVLLNCGEKDPFVDDTVIFAGRIRQAKLARREHLASKVAGRRPGTTSSMNGDDSLRILSESDEDWVQMRIIEGWSHGYLQMYQLIPEVKVAIQHLAAWMEEVFASADVRRDAAPRTRPASRSTSRSRGRNPVSRTSETETDDVLTFRPKKKRSPRHSSDSEEEDADEDTMRGRGGAERRVSESSSGETVVTIGPRTPDSSELSTKGTLQVPSAKGSQGTRTGTPLFAQSKNPPLSEAEMMKRRREEAVLGLVAEQVVEAPVAHGRSGSW